MRKNNTTTNVPRGTINKGTNKMEKEKIYYWEKFNPIELWMWQNKKHLGSILKMSLLTPYGSRNSKWRYDMSTGEFTWNQFLQVDKHEWSKEPKQKRILAIKLLRGSTDAESPMWVEFQKALKKELKQD